MSGEWEKMPGMQRVITLDGVIYVHENARRRRVRAAEPSYLEADPAVPESDPAEPEADPAEPEPLAEVAAVTTAVEEPEPPPEPVAAQPEKTSMTIVRNGWKAPPPGYAIEFGTGRIVPIRSYKGRMT